MEQMNLFSSFSAYSNFNKPLATRLRPRDLDEFVGQRHLLDKGKVLRQMIESDNIGSMIFWGPPGVGKTTLAGIIANITKSRYVEFSAVSQGIKEIKDIMKEAEEARLLGKRTMVFVDEIHRFNKAQQDAFLPYVEKGSIVLIGATTENPSFEVNAALLSRAKVFVLKALEKEDIISLLKRSLEDTRAFPDKRVHIDEDTLNALALYANGDARNALNTLELAVNNVSNEGIDVYIDKKVFSNLLDKNVFFYDKNGEEHYNLISALHKTMRNSDPDGSIYWLSRMLESGEKPLYIARRIIQFASEDIGLADNRALGIAIDTYNACHYLGLPDCDLALTQAVIYMALAPKSNSVYKARLAAKADVKNTENEPVPLHLRNAPTKLMAELGYGKDYKYAHSYSEHISNMKGLPPILEDRVYYEAGELGEEREFKERLAYIKEIKHKMDT